MRSTAHPWGILRRPERPGPPSGTKFTRPEAVELSRHAGKKEDSALFSQAHTVRGFVSILGGNGGEKIESAKNEKGERIYRIAK